jgi:hypothetical protein
MNTSQQNANFYNANPPGKKTTNNAQSLQDVGDQQLSYDRGSPNTLPPNVFTKDEVDSITGANRQFVESQQGVLRRDRGELTRTVNLIDDQNIDLENLKIQLQASKLDIEEKKIKFEKICNSKQETIIQYEKF